MPIKISYIQKENQSNHPPLQETKMNCNVVASSKRELKLFDVEKLANYKFLAFFFSWSIQGRDCCRLDPTTLSRTRIRCLTYGFEKRYRFCWLSQMALFNFVFWRDGWFVWLSFCSWVFFRCKTFKKSDIQIFWFSPLFIKFDPISAFLHKLFTTNVDIAQKNGFVYHMT